MSGLRLRSERVPYRTQVRYGTSPYLVKAVLPRSKGRHFGSHNESRTK